MKRVSVFSLAVFLFVFSCALAEAAHSGTKNYSAGGEVVSVDPVYSRVTLKHGVIKGFSAEGESDFAVSSAALLKNLSKRDLVDFELVEKKGDVEVAKITKRGVAPEPNDSMRLGQAIQDVLVGTGEVMKTVSEPIPPANAVVSQTVKATTDATGPVLKDATPEIKKKF